MEKNLLRWKAALAACWTGICAVLGWRGLMGLAWIGVMALDYLSGTAAAMKAGDWNSKRAREGLWHKGGMFFTVAAAGVTDGILVSLMGNIPALGVEWPGLALPLVLTWYILTELGSILENAVKLGAQVPGWLTGLLKVTRDTLDHSMGEKDQD